MCDISVIVPVYNSSKYLSKCLDSLVNQSHNCYEIIIINDGSTDDSYQIIRLYSEKYDFITVINQENSGVSSARNKGINLARGKYIMFVDADDWINEVALEKFNNFAEELNVDCIIGYWNEIRYGKYEKMNNTVPIINHELPSDTRVRILDHFFKSRSGGAPWAKFFRRSIILENDTCFPTNLPLGEDYIFLLRYLSVSDTVAILSEPLYFYRMDGVGAAAKFRKDYFDIQVYIEQEKVKLIEKVGFKSKEYDEALTYDYIRCCINSYINIFRGNSYDRLKEVERITKFYYTLEMALRANQYKMPLVFKLIAFCIRNNMIMIIYYICFYISIAQKIKINMKNKLGFT